MEENDYIERNQDFFRLLLCILDFRSKLTEREIKYLLWRFYNRMTAEQIAKYDGKRISRSAVNQVMESAYKKIRLKTLDK
jgi:DNA-directed RNA polymerase specialized sigma subunit